MTKGNNFSHIVGGENIKEYKSWMAAMLINGSQACGAMLIAPQWVISARHCTEHLDISNIIIKLGGVNLQNDDEFETMTVIEKVEHPSFDVVLLKLSQPSELSKPIKVNNNDELPEGLVVKAIGWGKLGETKGTSNILQTVDLPLVSDEECYRVFGSRFNNKSMICAGYKEGMKDACQGDSGGPLFVETPQGDVLVGVTSWGEGCARSGVYGVWARLSQLNDWIDNNIDYNSLEFVDAVNGDSDIDEVDEGYRFPEEVTQVNDTPSTFMTYFETFTNYSSLIIILLLIIILIRIR
jgi:secreted trypsin-like serine protease